MPANDAEDVVPRWPRHVTMLGIREFPAFLVSCWVVDGIINLFPPCHADPHAIRSYSSQSAHAGIRRHLPEFGGNLPIGRKGGIFFPFPVRRDRPVCKCNRGWSQLLKQPLLVLADGSCHR